ncbi:hypothetical protein ACEQ8H_000343 [Pleosporales sp. CAS-2024a]
MHTAAASALKHRISNPFGFQHLTHGDRQHHAVYDYAQERMAQPTPDLAKHHSHFRNFSSDDLVVVDKDYESPTHSPHLHQSSTASGDQAGRPPLRLTRSVESFSQPGVNARTHRHSHSVLASPRQPSLSSLAPIDDVPEEGNHMDARLGHARTMSRRESGVWGSLSLCAPSAESESVYFAHAFTTPDDNAIPALPTPFSPSLDDVTEEPESFSRPRTAPAPPSKGPSTPRSPLFDSTIFSNPRSPTARSPGMSDTSPRSLGTRAQMSRPLSGASDTLGSDNFVRHGLTPKPCAKRRQSNTWRAPEASWEDDIDYIYENALEADCDFEWDCASDGETGKSTAPVSDRRCRHVARASSTLQQPLYALQPVFEPAVQQHPARNFRVSLRVPTVPELVPPSATSVSTPGTGLTTPCDAFPSRLRGEVGGFVVSPSLLIPPDYKDEHDHMYEDLLTAYEDSDRHFTMLDARYSATSSARSRRSSYDSSLMSSAQSSGMWSSPVRRSASSTGSVPDLVPSRRTRRDIGISLLVDQLCDSVTSLPHLDEGKEDQDMTPPGRVLENRTFFPDDDEADVVTTNEIEEEVRVSLELAQRGAAQDIPHQPSRHQKQARSDGAVHLLAKAASANAADRPTMSHGRTATVSNATNSPLLGLFPAPPRNPRKMQ